MCELPSSWGLKERKRSDGKLDLVGKADNGDEYVARTTEGAEVSPGDVDSLAAGDRERTNPREFTARAIRAREREKEAHEAATLEAFSEPAEELARNYCEALHLSMGDAYERGAKYWGVPVGEYADMWRAIEFDDYLEDRKRRK